MEALHDINVGVADVLQWAALMLAVFEIPLLMRRELLSESLRDASAEFPRGLQRKKLKATAPCLLPTLPCMRGRVEWGVRFMSGSNSRFCHHGSVSDSRSGETA
jgi:hypothetical protein